LNYSIPVIALPTTAGTGSEVTPFATVWDDKEKRKCSLASKTLFPHTAIIDSELFTTLPDDVLISTGLDAINQAIESIWNKNATPITLSYAFQSLKIGMPALVNLTKDRTSNYYSNLGYSSLLSGLAISHTRTSICHSISYPITAHYQVPHGIACAFTMPEVLKLCIQTEPNLFAQLAKYLINNDSNVYDLLDYFVSFNKHFDVSNRIKKYINRIEDLYSISDKMITKGRMDNGIIDFNKNQIEKLLLNSWNL
jgi:alcohol dehydrogenase